MRHSIVLRVVVAVCLILGLPAVAGAAPGAADATGYVRLGHFAPGQGPVDVVVDGKVAATGLDYRQVTGYLQLPAGDHHFELRAPGASEPVLAADAGVPAD